MSAPRWWRAAKGWPGWLLVGVVAVTLMVVGVSSDTSVPTAEERIEEISKRLACPICDGESVFESRNNASEAIRTKIRTQVEGGAATDDDIVSFIEQRYEGRVLLVPRSTGIDALAWALPVFVAVCAVAGLGVAFWRWRRAAGSIPTDDDRAIVAAALEAQRDDDA